jgi:hypothetical protein
LQCRGNGFESRILHMSEADEIKLQVAALNQRAHEIIVALRGQAALLEELSIDYGNISPHLAIVESVLEVVERHLKEEINSIHLAVRRANDWAEVNL